MSLFAELKRRNVFRVGIAYAVAAWLLMQLADVLVQLLELPSFIGKAVVVFLAIGFPLALIFAWAFELTPEGIKREAEVDRSQSLTHHTGKKLDRVIITVLTMVVAWFLVDEFYLEPLEQVAPTTGEASSKTATKSIAVLPFADMSEGQDQAWFADGLAEEILNALARAPDLLVSSRTASFAYKGQQLPLTRIAAELGVDHVLEGSVRRAGDRIRITAQLIRAEDGFHVWSENYDRKAEDVIELQEDLAVSIAKALKTTMDPEALEQMLSAGTRSVAAYEHYLNGLALQARVYSQSEFELMEQALDEFEAARRLDPAFSDAHAQAAAYWLQSLAISRRQSARDDVTLEQRMALFSERIRAAIDTAPNPTDRKRHEVQLAISESRFRDALHLARQVFEARPLDFDNLENLSEMVIYLADEQALRETTDQLLAHWQNGPQWAQEYVESVYRIDGKVDDVPAFVSLARQMVQRYPTPGLAYQVHRSLLWLGEVEEARRLLPMLANDEDGRDLVQARQACAEGRRADAEAILAGLDRLGPQDRATNGWHIHKLLGQEYEAAQLLKPYESAAAPVVITNYLIYPDFDPQPFPVVMEVLRREGVTRPAPVPIPFACPATDQAGRQSVAVLPFVAMSSGEDDGYFADGLTEEILNTLTALPELLVTARTSSFHFKGKDLPIPEIARQLDVDHVVEGSVRRAGERARITAQLVRAGDGFHLWSQTYDRTLEDVFAVQEDIAASIARTLDVVLDDRKRELMQQAGIGDVDAFIAYQKGLNLFYEAHENLDLVIEGLAKATPLFDQALAAAPDLIAARVLKADAAGHVVFDFAAGRLAESKPGDARTALDALREEYELAWQNATPGSQRDVLDVERSLFDDDWTGLRAKLERALQPGNCSSTNWTVEIAQAMGLQELLLPKLRERLRCDPYQPLANFQLAFTLFWSGDPTAALQAASDSQARGISFEWLNQAKAYAALALGDLDNPEVSSPNDMAWISFPRAILRHAAAGDLAAGRPLAEAFWNSPAANDWSSLMPAAILGDRERANAIAARIDGRPGSVLVLANVISLCACGAPFDLDATPNFKRRLEQAGFNWPPASPIDWPLKDW